MKKNIEPYVAGFFHINLDFSKSEDLNTSFIKDLLKDNMIKSIEDINKVFKCTATGVNFYDHIVELVQTEMSNIYGPVPVYRCFTFLYLTKIQFRLDTYSVTPDSKDVTFCKSFDVIAKSDIDSYYNFDITKVTKVEPWCKFNIQKRYSFLDSYNRCKELHDNLKPITW